MKRKRAVAIIVVVSIFVTSIVVGFYLSPQTTPNPQVSPTPQISPTRKPVIVSDQFSPYYLHYQGDSRILVASANASYGSYPYPTVTNFPSGSPIAENGEPCVIINVTLRNDYSTQNPAPNPYSLNSTKVYVALTALLFSGKEPISAKDITNANWISSASSNRGFTSLDYGESATLSLYLATNNKDITDFLLSAFYIGILPPP
jgi:hypothetical protein